MAPGIRSLSGIKRKALSLIVDVPLTRVFIILSLTSSTAPLLLITSSKDITTSVALSADVPSAGVSETSDGGVVSGVNAVTKVNVKIFSKVRPSISLTAVVTTIVYCISGKKNSLGIMLIFSSETDKTAMMGSLSSSAIYTDDASTVVPSIAAEKLSITYLFIGTGELFGLEATDTRRYFEESTCTSPPLLVLPQPVNINMNVNKNADKIFTYNPFLLILIASCYCRFNPIYIILTLFYINQL